MKMRALFLALGLSLPGLPAFACDMDVSHRGLTVADYVETVQPCLATLPDGFRFDAAMEQDFLRRINAARKAEGLPPLIYRPYLLNTARFHSLDMAYNDFFSHDGPDGRRPQDRVSAFDRRALVSFSAENVAMVEVVNGRWNLDKHAVDRLHQNLMDSPGHRANILTEEATHIAIGVVRTEHGVWVTQSFMSLSGSLAEDVPVRMHPGQKIRQMPVLDGWDFRQFAAALPDGEIVSLERGIPSRLSGDVDLVAEGRRPGNNPFSYFTVRLPGPAVTVGG